MRRVQGKLYLAVLIATGLGAACLFLERIPPLRLLVERVVIPFTFSLPVSLAALGAGFAARRALTRWFDREAARTSRSAQPSFDFALGLPLFGTFCFLVALGSTAPLWLLATTVAFALVGLWGLIGSMRRGIVWPHLDKGPSTLLAGAFLLGLCIAQLPPYTLDEVAYHLAVPKAWVLEGRVVELPLNSHSYFPFGIEATALPLLALFGDLGATSFHFVILTSFSATLSVLYTWLAEYGSPKGAELAVVAVATTPALMLTSGTGWIDAPFLGTSAALCLALERAARRDFAWGALAPVVIAIAAGTLSKYTWAAVLVATFAAGAVCTRGRPAALGRLAAAAALGLALGSAFFVRNLVWTKNPVAPFLDASTPHVAAFNEGDSPLALLLNYVSDPIMVDESLGVVLLALAIAFLIGVRGPTLFARALGLSAIAMLCVVGGLGAAGRILVPFLAIAGGLGAVSALQLLEGSKPSQRAFSTLVLALCTLQFLFLVTVVNDKRPFEVLAGDETNVLTRTRPTYPAVAWLNRELPPSSRTLVLGIHESYWFQRSVRAGGNFDGPRVAAYLRATSPAELYAKLKRDGFTHVAAYARNIIVGEAQSSGRRAETKTVLDPATADLLRRMLQTHAVKLGEQHGVALLALR